MTVTSYRYAAHDEPEELAGTLAGLTCHTVPRAATRFRIATALHRLGDAQLVVVDSSPNYTLAEVAPGMALIQLPVSGHECYTINGAALRCGDYFVYGPGGGFERASTGEARTALLILPAALAAASLPEAAAEAVAGSRPPAPRRGAPAAWSALCALLAEADRTPLGAEPGEAQRGFRAAVLESFRNLMTTEGPAGRAACHRGPARQSIVRRADAYLRENVGRPIYTEELCAALGVSPAALSAAFRASFGISPHRYLKLRRLAMVRAVLRNGGGGPMLVKSAALGHGFWHLGQFARDYHAAYGEKPSETRALAA
jgi:AraC-like DNA-binding protein